MGKDKAIRVYVSERERDEINEYVDEHDLGSASNWLRRLALKAKKGESEPVGNVQIDEDHISDIVSDATREMREDLDDVLWAVEEIKELVESDDDVYRRAKRVEEMLRVVPESEVDEFISNGWDMSGVEPSNEEEAVLLKGSAEAVAAMFELSLGEARETLIALKKMNPDVEVYEDRGTRRYYIVEAEGR